MLSPFVKCVKQLKDYLFTMQFLIFTYLVGIQVKKKRCFNPRKGVLSMCLLLELNLVLRNVSIRVFFLSRRRFFASINRIQLKTSVDETWLGRHFGGCYFLFPISVFLSFFLALLIWYFLPFPKISVNRGFQFFVLFLEMKNFLGYFVVSNFLEVSRFFKSVK